MKLNPTIKKSDNLESVLRGFIMKWILASIDKFRENDFDSNEYTNLNIPDIIISLIEGEETDAYKLIEDYLGKRGRNPDPSFLKHMEHISEKYPHAQRGINIADRFGAFE